MTKSEWTDETWNPVVGCSVVSPGCTHCYAMGMAARLERMLPPERRGTIVLPNQYSALTKPSAAGPVWTGRVTIAPDTVLTKPLRWRRPRRVFVNSMGDLFHESVPDEWIDRVFAVMALTPRHTYQVLTKRSARMREYMNGIQSKIPFLGRMPLERVHLEAAGHMEGDGGFMDTLKDRGNVYSLYLDAPWPLPNVWLGVSTEDQRRADERVPDLLATPAAIRFVSAEPLLGPLHLGYLGWPREGGPLKRTGYNALIGARYSDGERIGSYSRLDWVIVGGESGPRARPMHPGWARSIRDQCAAAGVPFFFKQWGEWGLFEPRFGSHEQFALANDGTLYRSADLAWPDGARRGEALRADHDAAHLTAVYKVGKRAAGRELDGRTHDAMPEAGARRLAARQEPSE